MTAPQLDLVFGALADTTRRAILDRASRGEVTVNDLVASFDLSQPTISKHLKVLERAGLVSRGRHAQFRPVRLAPAALASADHWLGAYRRLWDDRLLRLDSLVEDLKRQGDAE
jgi:DNA-binding transcriptional ArsR family regulator